MIGNLDPSEIEHLLHAQPIGRIGIQGDGSVFIFPIAIGYDGVDLYGHSSHGQKIRLMRSHPEVCVEVEEVESPAHWRTVMVHGSFEEISDPQEKEAALIRITQQGSRVSPPSMAPYIKGPEALVVYRIRVASKTGRYERDELFPARN